MDKIKIRRLLPVIVSFNTSGVMKPVKLQIENSVYSIDMCYLKSNGGPNITYTCDIQCGNTHGTVDITYIKSRKQWFMEY